MTTSLQLKCLKGNALAPYLQDLVQLRLKIFHDFPYLYEVDLEHESAYLKTYLQCTESVMIVVFDNEKVVGVSTGIPMEFETIKCQSPFIQKGLQLQKIFFLGESLLLPEYRGRNIYRHFFIEREAAAKNYGCNLTTFCAIERDPNDPRRPQSYVPLDSVWQHFGYTKQPDLFVHYSWKEAGSEGEARNKMVFWTKTI